jgi:hypothetical protein
MYLCPLLGEKRLSEKRPCENKSGKRDQEKEIRRKN